MRFSIKLFSIFIFALILAVLVGALRKNDNFESDFPGEGENEEVSTDLPIYPGSKLIDSSSSSSENKKSLSYIWEVDESVENLSSFIVDKLRSDGWSVEINSLVISFKKDGAGGFIGLAKKSDDTTIVSATLTKINEN